MSNFWIGTLTWRWESETMASFGTEYSCWFESHENHMKTTVLKGSHDLSTCAGGVLALQHHFISTRIQWFHSAKFKWKKLNHLLSKGNNQKHDFWNASDWMSTSPNHFLFGSLRLSSLESSTHPQLWTRCKKGLHPGTPTHFSALYCPYLLTRTSPLHPSPTPQPDNYIPDLNICNLLNATIFVLQVGETKAILRNDLRDLMLALKAKDLPNELCLHKLNLPNLPTKKRCSNKLRPHSQGACLVCMLLVVEAVLPSVQLHSRRQVGINSWLRTRDLLALECRKFWWASLAFAFSVCCACQKQCNTLAVTCCKHKPVILSNFHKPHFSQCWQIGFLKLSSFNGQSRDSFTLQLAPQGAQTNMLFCKLHPWPP